MSSHGQTCRAHKSKKIRNKDEDSIGMTLTPNNLSYTYS